MRKLEKQLFRAIAAADIANVKDLLGSGVNPNVFNNKTERITPLMAGASVNSTETIKLLLDHGADREAEDFLGREAYEYAEKYNAKAAMLTLMFYVSESDKTSSNVG